jgi:hypothetical protein
MPAIFLVGVPGLIAIVTINIPPLYFFVHHGWAFEEKESWSIAERFGQQQKTYG